MVPRPLTQAFFDWLSVIHHHPALRVEVDHARAKQTSKIGQAAVPESQVRQSGGIRQAESITIHMMSSLYSFCVQSEP